MSALREVNDLPAKEEAAAYLHKEIERLENQIVDLVPAASKSQARLLFNIIHAQRVALASLNPEPNPQKYGRYRRAVDAARDFLKEINKPVTQQELIDELVRGGFRNGQPDAWVDVKKSIRHHTQTEQGLGKKRLRESNGYVGLYEWPDERFR